jgi:hypothetical protein
MIEQTSLHYAQDYILSLNQFFIELRYSESAEETAEIGANSIASLLGLLIPKVAPYSY